MMRFKLNNESVLLHFTTTLLDVLTLPNAPTSLFPSPPIIVETHRNISLSPLELFLSRSPSPLKKVSPVRPRSSFAYLPETTSLKVEEAARKARKEDWSRGEMRKRPATSLRRVKE